MNAKIVMLSKLFPFKGNISRCNFYEHENSFLVFVVGVNYYKTRMLRIGKW